MQTNPPQKESGTSEDRPGTSGADASEKSVAENKPVKKIHQGAGQLVWSADSHVIPSL